MWILFPAFSAAGLSVSSVAQENVWVLELVRTSALVLFTVFVPKNILNVK